MRTELFDIEKENTQSSDIFSITKLTRSVVPIRNITDIVATLRLANSGYHSVDFDIHSSSLGLIRASFAEKNGILTELGKTERTLGWRYIKKAMSDSNHEAKNVIKNQDDISDVEFSTNRLVISKQFNANNKSVSIDEAAFGLTAIEPKLGKIIYAGRLIINNIDKQFLFHETEVSGAIAQHIMTI